MKKKLTWEYLVAVAGVVVTLLLVWFIGIWVHFPDSAQGNLNLLILRLGIFVLGILCVVGFLLWAYANAPTVGKLEMPKAPSGLEMPKAPSGAEVVAQVIESDVAPDNIDRLIREAELKVASSRLGHGAKLSALPTILILGETGAGKTSVVLNCGLDAELLAGQIYQEGNVAPTAVANLWFARKAIFVEAAGKLSADPKPWVRMIHRLTPGRFRSIFRKRTQAPRAALVCFDCEKLAEAAATDALATVARTLRARLEEMSQEFGVSFPVYALFCKLDRVAYFTEFAGTLRDEDIVHVLGATLPVVGSSGVYAEQETRRLTAAFQSLFSSLADCRTALLGRERDTTKQPGVYEFPRQFRRLGKPVVEFLVELCRPSHLRAGPFLRGFYFVGRRMVASNAVSPAAFAAQTMIRPSTDFSANATTILRADSIPSITSQFDTGTMIQGASETRLTPQHVFLSHLFSDVLLQDRAALGASGTSTKVSFWRRLLFASLALIFAFLTVAFLISGLSNLALKSKVTTAAQNIHFASQPGPGLASAQDWRELDALRQPLQALSDYEANGVPLHLRWGLYAGHDLYAEGRRVYFARFRQLLFDQTSGAMHLALLRLPASPAAADNYNNAYEPLRAYLITTTHHEKATREFLTPRLMKYWLAGRDLDDDRRQLVETQLDFYSDELKIKNPYADQADEPVVNHARAYLRGFEATQRIYHQMLGEASKANPGLNFNKKYPDAGQVVRDPQEVEGGYTKQGWNFMQDAFLHWDRYVSGDQWVLGDQSGGSGNTTNLEQQLRAMYTKDYVKAWRDFLNAATVLRYAGYVDEGNKLQILSQNRSPLLMLVCEVSQNIPADPDLAKALAPAQQTVPAPCQDKVVQPPTQPYVGQLMAAANCFEQIQPTLAPEQRDAALIPCNAASGQARLAADQIAQTFAINPEGVDQTVKRLLEAPTTPAAPPPPPGPAGQQQLCDALKGLDTKYPFESSATQEATLDDFNKVFQPGAGLLSKFLDQNKAVFELQGSRYVQKSGKPNLPLQYLINQAADIQQMLYPQGSATIQFKFTVKANLPSQITSDVLKVDGHGLPLSSTEQAFVWSGNGGEASVTINGLGVGQFFGAWAPFRLFDNYTWTPGPSGYHLKYQLRGLGGQSVPNPDLELASGTVPLFERGFLSKLKCPAH